MSSSQNGRGIGSGHDVGERNLYSLPMREHPNTAITGVGMEGSPTKSFYSMIRLYVSWTSAQKAASPIIEMLAHPLLLFCSQ